MKLFLNNKLIDTNEAMVSVFDHGFLYGLGLFETFRTYNGLPFLLQEHLHRLKTSCEQLGIAYTVDEKELREQIALLLSENNLVDGYFRLTVSAGEEELGLPAKDYTNPTTILMCKPLPASQTNEQWSKGKAAICLKTRRNSPEAAIRFKSLHYMNNIIAKREIRSNFSSQFASAEGLMLNNKGELSEGIVSNVFFRKGETIFTPAIDTGILPGITRAFVIELCKQNGYLINEGYFNWDSLVEADEIWLTNSIQAIIPVTALVFSHDRIHTVGDGIAGVFTRQLHLLYQSFTT